jgi:hypothetical protein
MMRTEYAASTPLPSPLAVNKPGDSALTIDVTLKVVPSPVCTVIEAVPVPVPAGTSKLI